MKNDGTSTNQIALFCYDDPCRGSGNTGTQSRAENANQLSTDAIPASQMLESAAW